MDAAVSAYNQNLRSQPQDLEDNFWSRSLKSVFTPRLASRYNGAIDALMKYQHRHLGFNLRYKRIDADYQSMGAWFLQHDLENLTGGIQLDLKNSTWRIQGDYGWQRNNVTHLHASDTRRQIGQFHIQYIPAPNSYFHFQYFNYTTELRRRREVLEDTLALHQFTQHFNCGGQWSIVSGLLTHTIGLEGFYRRLNNQVENGDALYKSLGGTLTYTCQINKTGIGSNLYLDSYEFNHSDYTRIQPGMTLTTLGMKDRLSLSLRMTLGLNYKGSVWQNTAIMPGLNVNYKTSPWQSFYFYFQFIQYRVSGTSLETGFSESRGGLTCTYRLH